MVDAFSKFHPRQLERRADRLVRPFEPPVAGTILSLSRAVGRQAAYVAATAYENGETAGRFYR